MDNNEILTDDSNFGKFEVKQEYVDRFINWVALSETITGKPQNIRKDLIPKKYIHDVHRLRSTIRNWLLYTKVYIGS